MTKDKKSETSLEKEESQKVQKEKSDKMPDPPVIVSQLMLGTTEPFILGDDFEVWIERLNNYFDINKITDDDFKGKLLMNVIGATASAKVSKSFKPKKFTDYNYKEIEAKCKKLFVGEKSTMVEQHKFHSRSQKEGESISDFAVELQALAEHCNFDNHLDHALRGRFVTGLGNKKIMQHLLNLEGDPNFEKVVMRAEKEELANLQATKMSNSKESTSDGVNAMRAETAETRGRPRYRNDTKRNNSFGPAKDNFGKRRRVSLERIKCYACQRMGHYASDCRNNRSKSSSRSSSRGRQEHQNHSVRGKFGRVDDNDSSSEADELLSRMSTMLGECKINKTDLALETMNVEGVKWPMEIDTGSCVTVCSMKDLKKNFPWKKLEKASRPLTVVSGESLKVMGKIKVAVKVHGAKFILSLHVIETKKHFIPLMGRDWLDKVCPSWRKALKINNVGHKDELREFREIFKEKILKKFSKLFDNDMSSPIADFKVDIRMKEDATPFVHKAYNVPFSVREEFVRQIDEMENNGLLEKVEYSDWASPVVAVEKPNQDPVGVSIRDKKQLRICLDGSRTINPHIETHHYPLPVIDELLANKSGTKYFCMLDLKGAYQQLLVSESTKKLLTINTIKGLYRYTRLPFGVKPAASIFQSVMDQILKNINNVQAYIDDILCWGATIKELYEVVMQILDRLLKFNVKVNAEKCHWFVDKVKYLGHILTEEGIIANDKGTRAIVNAPEPKNVSEVRSFVGMVMFYSKFIPKLNAKLAPLYHLLKKESKFNWNNECREAFESCKREISSPKILAHYDPKKPIIVTTDASDKGIGAVLSHRINGQERPVFFISRTLTKAEQKYPILHREALGIVYAMERFYKYIYGQFVEIYTDHRPLVGIFHAKKGEPPIVATRLQRYIMRMSIFNYSLTHRRGADIGHADCLSRLPIEDKPNKNDLREGECYDIKSIVYGGPLTLDVKLIKLETSKDLLLSQVLNCVRNGWPKDKIPKELKPFFTKNGALSIECGCLVLEGKLIIPPSLRKATLEVLHSNHMGMVKMKILARKYVQWDGMTRDIEKYVSECEACQVLRKDKPNKEYGKWPEANVPFERVHIDFFHFMGKTFFILIDAYSHWLEIKQMSTTNAEMVIKELSKIFGMFGFAGCVVSDNGPPFNSYELRKYLETNGVKKLFSPPFHPQSNGLVERAVQTVKSVLRKFVNESNNQFQLSEAIEKFLQNYRQLPTTSQNIIPAEKIFAYKQRNIFKALELPTIKIKKTKRKVSFKLAELKDHKNELNKQTIKNEDVVKLKFKIDENVLYLSKLKGYTYSYHAKIIKQLSAHIYQINVGGNVKNAHINQLRKSILKPWFKNISNEGSEANNEIMERTREEEDGEQDEVIFEAGISSDQAQTDNSQSPTINPPTTSTRPQRVRIPTEQFQANWNLPCYGYKPKNK